MSAKAGADGKIDVSTIKAARASGLVWRAVSLSRDSRASRTSIKAPSHGKRLMRGCFFDFKMHLIKFIK